MKKLKTCLESCKCSRQPNQNAWKCKVSGSWKYENLPDGMRNATIQDFYKNHTYNYGIKYLAKSFYTGIYYAYSFTENIDVNQLLIYIKEKRVFVKNNHEK